MDLIVRLAQELSLSPEAVEKTVALLDEGQTIPFIARYRKEVTGGLEDVTLRALESRLKQLRNLEEKREDILRKMETLGVLTVELAGQVKAAETVTELEDLYRPYRPKRRTRGVIAREKGYGPIGELFLKNGATKEDLVALMAPLLEEASEEDILQGARDVVAEIVGDDPRVRSMVKMFLSRAGSLVSSEGKNPSDTYEMYKEHQESLRRPVGYRILAMDRGEREEALKISLAFDEELLTSQILSLYNRENPFEEERNLAVKDGLKRLVYPAVEREIRHDLTAKAQSQAIAVFGENLRPLLLGRPLAGARILALDPGIRTGCKFAVLDPHGAVLNYGVFYLVGSTSRKAEALRKMETMIRKYAVNVIAIGNGTASRETEKLVADLIREKSLDVRYAIVNEAGASIYSASEVGVEEFPDLDVTIRGAISIGRRLQDPLAELVKIEPRHIGVGQYQHDLNRQELEETLDGVVEDCVNSVGVDVNTASKSLLEHVAGFGPKLAKSLVDTRHEKGPFRSRKEIQKVPGLGPKTYQQAAGFLRIPDGEDLLDRTAVHPESYDVARKLMDKDLDSLNLAATAEELGVGLPTLQDIVAELKKPGRDPRQDLEAPILRSDVLAFEDLTVGMVLKGTVRNVVDFGAFVDIGVKQDGLIHRSAMAGSKKHPRDLFQVGDIVEVAVESIDEKRHRIGLEWRPQ